MDVNEITEQIIGAAIEVHKNLGPGLLESAYQQALAYELDLRKIKYKLEVTIPIPYKDALLKPGFRADMIVDDVVVVEIKAQKDNTGIFMAQIFTNMRLSSHKVGLVLNFHHKRMVDGIKRYVF